MELMGAWKCDRKITFTLCEGSQADRAARSSDHIFDWQLRRRRSPSSLVVLLPSLRFVRHHSPECTVHPPDSQFILGFSKSPSITSTQTHALDPRRVDLFTSTFSGWSPCAVEIPLKATPRCNSAGVHAHEHLEYQTSVSSVFSKAQSQ